MICPKRLVAFIYLYYIKPDLSNKYLAKPNRCFQSSHCLCVFIRQHLCGVCHLVERAWLPRLKITDCVEDRFTTEYDPKDRM